MKIILDYISITDKPHIHLSPQRERLKKERNFHCPCSRKSICTDEMKLLLIIMGICNCSSVKRSQFEDMQAKWKTSAMWSKTKHSVFKSLSSHSLITMAIPNDTFSRCDSKASSFSLFLDFPKKMQFSARQRKKGRGGYKAIIINLINLINLKIEYCGISQMQLFKYWNSNFVLSQLQLWFSYCMWNSKLKQNLDFLTTFASSYLESVTLQWF